jgi:hypothetical protein
MIRVKILSVWPGNAVKENPDLIEIGYILELTKNATIQIWLDIENANFIRIKS